MAASHLTLEEAAERLGLSPEAFKKRLKTDPSFKVLVPIRDGSTLRFKPAAVDELAHQLGAASDPELPLAGLDDSLPPDSDDFKLSAVREKVSKSSPDKKTIDESLALSDSNDDIFSLTSDEVKGKKPKSDPDSDRGSTRRNPKRGRQARKAMRRLCRPRRSRSNLAARVAPSSRAEVPPSFRRRNRRASSRPERCRLPIRPRIWPIREAATAASSS